MDLDAGASVADIREAYRLQVRTWNPDRPSYNPQVRAATERKLAEVRQAYEWLKSNGDAVVGQASGTGTQPTSTDETSTRVSKQVTNGVIYLVLVGLLMYGIVAVTSRNVDALYGPFITLTGAKIR